MIGETRTVVRGGKQRVRSVDDVVALLRSDQEDDRAAGILDPAVPPVEVLALASRPGNGYRVRAALALCGALPADMRLQILHEEYAAETRKHAMPGFFFMQLETYGRDLTRRKNLDENTRAAIAVARTMYMRWERATGGVPEESHAGRWAAVVLAVIAATTITYLVLASGVSLDQFLPTEFTK